jgi:large subunit ribosomal protein L27
MEVCEPRSYCDIETLTDAGEWVVPGVIIYRQRGTKWFPGENCDIGRDHTIFATEKGYVRYYKDARLHPKRRYIGVAIEKHLPLPTPLNAARRRRLNMVAVPRREEKSNEPWQPGEDDVYGIARDGTKLRMNENYSFAQANYLIGRSAELAGVKVRPFKKNDRWLAWRKRTKRFKSLEGRRAFNLSSKSARKSKQRKAVAKAK